MPWSGGTATFFTAAPAELFRDVPHARVPWTVDVGIAQRDSLTEDPEETRRRVDVVITEAAIDRLAEALRGFDRAVVDIAPPGMEAARRAGVPALAVGNFDWTWIYRHYPGLTDVADRFAAWQRPHPGLALWPGPGLSGFASVERFGLVGRRAPPVRVADRAVLVCFGGFGLDGLDALLPRIDGITYVLAPPMRHLERDDVRWVGTTPFPALVAGADALLTKPGYGIFAEAALAGTPIVWVDRGVFPEAPFLETALAARGDIKAAALNPNALSVALRERLSRGRPARVRSDAAERLAERILR